MSVSFTAESLQRVTNAREAMDKCFSIRSLSTVTKVIILWCGLNVASDLISKWTSFLEKHNIIAYTKTL